MASQSRKVTRLAYTSYFDRWLRLAAEFGCTPTSRARLQVPPKKEEEEPVQELLMRRMGLH